MSECEVAEFSRHSEPVARKEHRCCECRAPILVGERHFQIIGKWEGDLMEFRQHLACMEACMLVRDELNDRECICFGGLKDWFWEFREDSRAYSREPNKSQEAWQKLRDLVARIKWRERPFRRKR